MADPIRLRASGLVELFDCPARWKAKHIDGKFLPATGRQEVGTAVHAGAEIYDRARMVGLGVSHSDATEAAVEALETIDHDVDWSDIGGLAKAKQAAVLATVNFLSDPRIEASEYEEVELKCEPLQVRAGSIILEITGTTDRIRVVRDKDPVTGEERVRRGVRDVKTGKNAVDAYGRVKTQAHGPQLAVYELLAIMAERETGKKLELPADIAAVSTSNGMVGVDALEAPHKVLVGDGTNPGMLDYAAKMIENELFYGNPRSTFCTKRYCPAWPTCRFRFQTPVENDGPDIDLL